MATPEVEVSPEPLFAGLPRALKRSSSDRDFEKRDSALSDVSEGEPSRYVSESVKKWRSSAGLIRSARALRHLNSDLEDVPETEVAEAEPGAASKLWKKTKFKVSMSNALARREFESSDRFIIENEMNHMPILQSRSSDFIAELANGIAPRPYARGEVIARQGAPGTSLIFVLRGAVDISIGEHQVEELKSSHYFGETNLIGLENQWAATLTARIRCDICEFKREHWEKTLQAYPEEKLYFDSLLAANRSCTMDGTLTKTCKILQGLSETTLMAVDLHAIRRLYFPGEKLLVEGEPGDEFYMLVQGRAAVEIAGRVVRSEGCGFSGIDTKDDESQPHMQRERKSFHHFSDGPIGFGELGFLGCQEERSASVVAQNVCHVRILYRAVFLKALQDHGESLHYKEMAQFLENRYRASEMAPSKLRLREIKFFEEDCSDEFLDFIASNLENRVFLKGQLLLPEENSLYVLIKGLMHVVTNGIHTTNQKEGAVFGEIPALGLGRRGDTSSYETAQMCYVQVLHQSVIIRALELFPDERQKILMMSFRSEEEDEREGTPPYKRSSLKVGKVPLARRGSGFKRSTTTLSGQRSSIASSSYKSKTHKAFMRAMQKSQLFKDVSVAFLEHLSAVAIDRIYMPGDLIMEEGKKGDSMFIMVSGTAGVFVHDDSTESALKECCDPGKDGDLSRIGMLTSGSLSGELAMLGVSSTRSASIRAETLCSMWEISQENALSILSAFPEVNRQFECIVLERLERTAPSRVLQLSLFQSFDRKFRMLLGLYCEKRAYFPSQTILHEGRNCDGMYVVNKGRATLEKSTITIKTYTEGMHLSSTVMLGIHKRSLGTLIALRTCHILVITHTNFGLALEKYPCHQSYLDMRKHELEEYEHFRKVIQRITARKLVWRRYQGINASGEPITDEDSKTSDEALSKESFQVWKRYTKESKTQRMRLVARQQRAAEWVERKLEASEKRRAQDLARHLARNADSREPLRIDSSFYVPASNNSNTQPSSRLGYLDTSKSAPTATTPRLPEISSPRHPKSPRFPTKVCARPEKSLLIGKLPSLTIPPTGTSLHNGSSRDCLSRDTAYNYDFANCLQGFENFHYDTHKKGMQSVPLSLEPCHILEKVEKNVLDLPHQGNTRIFWLGAGV